MADSAAAARSDPDVVAGQAGHGFHRSVGQLSATAVNMTQMVGIGPFITIPLMVATFSGPQAIVGWVAGALLAVCDGLVWAELGAAMPATVSALVWSTVWLAAGAIAYLGWARYHRSWPFGEKEIHEEFLQNQRGHPERAASPGTGGEASWA